MKGASYGGLFCSAVPPRKFDCVSLGRWLFRGERSEKFWMGQRGSGRSTD